MMRFLKKQNSEQHEKTKFAHLKQACDIAVQKLIQLHHGHQTHDCVLVIGQPESGKSVLCSSHTKLLFPSSVELQSPEKNSKENRFEIYISEDTLFFHVPHDFFLFSDADLSQRLWFLLARHLRKYYLHIPITHCMVCIDLQDFLTRSHASNNTRLTQISLALNTLANGLKTLVHVGLFFTKADLIPGFVEFFDHESQEFLEQPWGISLEKTTEEAFSQAFDQLIKKLNERLIWSLHHETHAEKLHLIKTFPLLLENVKQKMLEILPEFFMQWTENRHLYTTQLYFVSCRQYCELIETSSTNQGTPKIYHHDNKHKNFFSKQAIEQQCHHQISHPLHTEKLTRSFFILLCGLILVAFINYFAQQFSHQIKLINSANKTIESALAFSKNGTSSRTLNEVSHELEKIHKTWENLNQDQQSSNINASIFTHSDKLDAQLQNVYQHILSQQWLPLVSQQLEDYINTNLLSSPEKSYIAFAIYMMLTQTQCSVDGQFIAQHLPQLLNSTEAPPSLLLSNIQKNILVVNENSPFIEKVRAHFAELAPNKLAYILLYSTINTQAAINLSNQLNIQQLGLVIDKRYTNIAEIYTKTKFEHIYQKHLRMIANQAINGNNILGKFDRQGVNLDDLLTELQTQYLKLYSSAWEEAIQHAHLSPVQSLDELATQLGIITSVNSPILTLLNLSQTNTHIPQIEQASAFLTTFNNTLTKESTPENNALYRSFALLIRLHQQILSTKSESHQGVNICTLLANENAATPQNPTEAKQLSLLVTQLPDPIQAWLQQIVDSYFTLLHEETEGC